MCEELCNDKNKEFSRVYFIIKNIGIVSRVPLYCTNLYFHSDPERKEKENKVKKEIERDRKKRKHKVFINIVIKPLCL
jgi:hypothetical protein